MLMSSNFSLYEEPQLTSGGAFAPATTVGTLVVHSNKKTTTEAAKCGILKSDFSISSFTSRDISEVQSRISHKNLMKEIKMDKNKIKMKKLIKFLFKESAVK
jgi:hypothetical protein